MATLGASNYSYAEATLTQSLPDWIGSHTRAPKFLGGVTEIIIPDNIKTGVTKSCRYEPDLNPTYQDIASHYGCAVIPARREKPKDKTHIESLIPAGIYSLNKLSENHVTSQVSSGIPAASPFRKGGLRGFFLLCIRIY